MKFKANILIITLFLLMMSSLSALLVSAYINNLIKFSASFHNYYRGYYIANAGLELALVKTNGNVRGYGFEDTVAADSATVTSNFSGANISFITTINTSATTLGDANTSKSGSDPLCGLGGTNTGWYEIPPGGCVPIILLKDSDQSYFNDQEGELEYVSDGELQSIGGGNYPTITLYGNGVGATVLLTLLDHGDFAAGILNFGQGRSRFYDAATLSNGQSNIVGNTASGDTAALPGGEYILMIANTDSTNTGHYCLESNIDIPTQYVTIDAQGTYSNVTLDLKGVRKAGLPADFCYTAISS